MNSCSLVPSPRSVATTSDRAIGKSPIVSDHTNTASAAALSVGRDSNRPHVDSAS